MIKTLSFAVVHFSVAYIISGSVLVGGAIALVEPMTIQLPTIFTKNCGKAGDGSHLMLNRLC